MPGVVRKTDVCCGHCFTPRMNCEWSPNVYANNLNVERKTDLRCIHWCGSSWHTGNNVGIHNVYANNLDVQTCMDPINWGCAQCQCSSNVFVNGGPG